MSYLLDTNICVLLIRQKSPVVLAHLRQVAPPDVGVSAITVAELQYGVHKSSRPLENQRALDQFLLPLTILPFDNAAAAAYGPLRAALEAQGAPIGALDMLIAAQALGSGRILVTNNVREFARVAGLSVQDWSVP